jgi:D-alanyl-D-alanine carboxypeptidase
MNTGTAWHIETAHETLNGHHTESSRARGAGNRPRAARLAIAIVSLCLIPAGFSLGSCARNDKVPAGDDAEIPEYFIEAEDNTEIVFGRFLENIILNAELPPETARAIRDAATAGPGFILEILTCLNGDPFLHYLVDKSHALPEGYAPGDLVELAGSGGGDAYRVSRGGLMLREAAAAALEEMAAAAHADGITLTVGSAYRSYAYQVEVYNRIVREMGVEAADRESAQPGLSQHQTGLVVDFAPIDDSFADTPEGAWVRENAERFGWSVSFPDGYEEVTGYRGESWHYRCLGRDLASFTRAYFGGIQQHALRFLHEWEQAEQR